MEKRRKKAGQLFSKDYSAPEVARRLGVARQVAYRWKSAWARGGSAALVSKGPAGPKSKLTSEQTRQVTKALLAGPAAHGYKTALWTLPRVAALIEDLWARRQSLGLTIIRVMFGACLEPVVSVASDRNAGRWNATRKPFAAGNGWNGRL